MVIHWIIWIKELKEDMVFRWKRSIKYLFDWDADVRITVDEDSRFE